MNKDRVILLCGGSGGRWNNYLNVPKHLIKINGQTLIERSVQLFSSIATYIIGNYHFPEVKTIIPNRYNLKNERRWHLEHPEDKFLSSKTVWNYDGYTIFVFGDVYFSENASELILETYNKQSWTAYGRPYPSKITKHNTGEMFVLSISSNSLEEFERCVIEAGKVKKQKIQDGHSNGLGWITYYIMCNKPVQSGWNVYDNFIKIDDVTDDFDVPHQYHNWMRYSGVGRRLLI